MVDADTMVYPNWLRDLIVPMIGNDVGIVTGNRWFDPTLTSWGSRVEIPLQRVLSRANVFPSSDLGRVISIAS